MKRKISYFENEMLEYLDDRSKLARLFDMELINNSGDPILVDSPNDQDGEKKEEFMKFKRINYSVKCSCWINAQFSLILWLRICYDQPITSLSDRIWKLWIVLYNFTFV